MTPKRLGLLAFLAYFFFAAGYVDTIDADASHESARSLLNSASYKSSPYRRDPMLYRPVGDSTYLSKLGVLTPILYVPAVLMGQFMAPYAPLSQWRVEQFFISFVNSIVCAFLVALLFRYFVSASFNKSTAVGLSVICGFGTLLFPFAKSAHREPFQALCLLGLAIYVSPYKKELRHAVLAGGFLALGFLSKNAFLVPAIPLVLYFLFDRRRHWRPFALPVLAALIIQWLFSLHYFGSPWGTGYSANVTRFGGSAWNTPFLSGIYQQLLSPQSGLLYYTPLFFLLPFVLFHRKGKERLQAYDGAILSAATLQLILYATWWSPTGGDTLGPRYLVVIIPLLFLAIRPDVLRTLKSKYRVSCALLLVLSFSFQLLSVSVKPQQYWTLQALAQEKLPTPQWAANFIFLKNKLETKEEVYKLPTFGVKDSKRVDLRPFDSFQGLNFWWLHASRELRKRRAEQATPEAPAVSEMDDPRNRG